MKTVGKTVLTLPTGEGNPRNGEGTFIRLKDGRIMYTYTRYYGDDWHDHTTLLENGFSHYRVQQVIQEGQCLGYATVFSGNEETVPLLSAEDFSFPFDEKEQPQVILSGPGFVYAPVIKGKTAGYAYVCIGDTAVGQVKLIYGQTVERTVQTKKPSFWQRLFGGGE